MRSMWHRHNKGWKACVYSFLAELEQSSAQQISIEAAQPKLDLGILADLAGTRDTMESNR